MAEPIHIKKIVDEVMKGIEERCKKNKTTRNKKLRD